MSILGLEEAAALLKCSPTTLSAMALAREVPATKIGKEWVFSARLLQVWVEERSDGPKLDPPPRVARARLAARLEQRERAGQSWRTATEGDAYVMTPLEVRELLKAMVREVLLERPAPSVMSVHDVAKLLDVTVRQVHALNLPRVGRGKVPYSAVLDVLAGGRR